MISKDHKKDILDIKNSDVTFEIAAAKATNDASFQEHLASVDVLILPLPPLFGYEGTIFTSGTRELLRHLADQGKDKFNIDVAFEKDEIEELVLHGDLISIGTILVKSGIAPFLLGLITNYVYDKLRNRGSKVENTIIRCELIVVDSDGSSRSLKYDGPTDSFEKTLGKALEPAKDEQK